MDSKGNLYFADSTSDRIRVLTPTGAACTYSVSPLTSTASVTASNLTVTIKTATSCGWSILNLPAWITVGNTSGSGSGTVTLAVAANTGPARSAQVSIAGVTITVSQPVAPLQIGSGAVANAASYTLPVAPGSITAIFGNFLLNASFRASSLPLSTNLGSLSLQFGPVLTPLFFASSGQVNGQVPWELAGQTGTPITAALNGQTSAPQAVTLAAYAPGIFTVNGEGTGQGAILDINYQLVAATNPAAAGASIQIYGTGLGPVTNQPATGAPSPGNPLAATTTQPIVTIGGVPATVQFAGLTPGTVGLYQINALVPAGLAAGDANVAVSIGGVQSNVVTMAVH